MLSTYPFQRYLAEEDYVHQMRLVKKEPRVKETIAVHQPTGFQQQSVVDEMKDMSPPKKVSSAATEKHRTNKHKKASTKGDEETNQEEEEEEEEASSSKASKKKNKKASANEEPTQEEEVQTNNDKPPKNVSKSAKENAGTSPTFQGKFQKCSKYCIIQE